MGILSGLGRTVRPLLTAAAGETIIPSGTAYGSIPADVLEAFGVHTGGAVTRQSAMRIPAMRRGRQIIAGTIGTLSLRPMRRDPDGELVPVERGATRTLLEQLNPGTTPQHTLTWTADDLLFHGIAWWLVTAVDAQGWPLAVERMRMGRVTVHGRQAYVDGHPVPDSALIRFDGADAGVLEDGRDAIRTCQLLEASARRNATGLPPMDILRPAEGAPDLTDPEVTQLLDDWAAARESYGTGYLNRALEHETVGFDARSAQLIEARQQQSVEIARMLNLDASELNAPAATGMTYTNTEAKRRDRLEALSPYITAITQRLSMPDVTPRGQLVQLDTTGYLRGTTADAIKAAVEAVTGRVMTTEETRERLLGLPAQPVTGTLAAPAPAPVTTPAEPAEQEA